MCGASGNTDVLKRVEVASTGVRQAGSPGCGMDRAGRVAGEVDFMVKLLRACVWMPRRKKAKKDAVSCDKPREAANRL